jgi:hypothetical protein
VRNYHRCLNVQLIGDEEEQSKASVLPLSNLTLVALYIFLHVLLGRNLACSISHHEIVILQNVVVLFGYWLTVSQRHNEKVRLKLLHCFT